MDDLIQVSAYGMTLIAILYYLNQAAKRNGYIPSAYMFGATLLESGIMVGLYFYAAKAFTVVVAALGMAAAVTLFHAGVKDKAKDEGK